jgi:hypothetical protein
MLFDMVLLNFLKKSCFDFQNFITKKMTKDIIIMISIIIYNYSNK